jgi:hypothetical protein
MRMTSVLRALVITTSLVCGACGPTIVMNPSGDEINPRRLMALPSDGVEYTFDIDANEETDKEGTRAALALVDTSVNYRVSESGGRFVVTSLLAQLNGYPAFRNWSELVLKDVTMAALGRLRDPPPSVSDWHFGTGVPSWRSQLSADHVLITMFVDGHDTAGRSIAVAFGGGWKAGHRIATCAVRLVDGRLVWCNVNLNMTTDIKRRRGAQRVVDKLLTGMLTRANAIPHPGSDGAAPASQSPLANEPSGPPPHQPDQD